MVLHGTARVTFWNVFFKDAATPIKEDNFGEIIYADDLASWKMYGKK